MSNSIGIDIDLFLADFPVDIFLLNDHSNYIKDPSKGKSAHNAKLLSFNLLNEIDFNRTTETFINFGEMGFSRNLTAFMTCKT